jgi:pyrroline-5-carboxylate reductase
MTQPIIAFIGAGNMASSLIRGLLAQGHPASAIRAADPIAACRDQLVDTGIMLTADNNAAIAGADVVVLAVKPQVMAEVLTPLAAAAQAARPLIISIAAGIRADSLQKWLGGSLPIVRCMPNTPALLQAGATGLHASEAVSGRQRQLADQILNAVGSSAWVDSEEQLDAVTAVSGSGPAYYFLVMEAMIEAGIKQGLSREVATMLTQQTALGAARMAIESDDTVAELRRKVTSPKGTTERAVETLEQGGLRELFERALADCAQRSVELAGELGD